MKFVFNKNVPTPFFCSPPPLNNYQPNLGATTIIQNNIVNPQNDKQHSSKSNCFISFRHKKEVKDEIMLEEPPTYNELR